MRARSVSRSHVLPSCSGIALLAVLGGCAASTGRAAPRTAAGATAPQTFRLDNGTLDRLDVYVVEETREWFLGRVEPGTVARLLVPPNARLDGRATVRLAVLANAPRTGRPSRAAGAVLTVGQPLSRLLAQEWLFAQGQLLGVAGRRPR
ncbi:hypothetical protein J421_5717 (plasmid) [Gemmatirosa kalamazoonensis]|uniref:Lipoprotein n=1 Tax=Gemmatirosa kalamazoonensis TaxID=861299 RepID=W0RS28_9BACT|nr:hypothetical protein [Gemmatirosa kalamazoonensis]AHG93252.1 hypothetical protein J421_5717 [Gemmatirosa kalamazoonensis]